jgi:hypothetical protein
MVSLLERAREGRMSFFYAKSTGKTNLPVIVMFVNIGV